MLNVVAKVKWNISLAKLVMVLGVVVPVGSVMLTRTVSRKMPVTFAVMLKLVPWFPVLGSAVTFLTSGIVTSLTTKVVVSVLLMLLLVSFAIINTVYVPGGSVSVGVNVVLNISPLCSVIGLIMFVPLGNVMLASTVSIFVVISVMLAVMLTVCVLLISGGMAVTLITSGGVVSMVTFCSVVKVDCQPWSSWRGL